MVAIESDWFIQETNRNCALWETGSTSINRSVSNGVTMHVLLSAQQLLQVAMSQACYREGTMSAGSKTDRVLVIDTDTTPCNEDQQQ